MACRLAGMCFNTFNDWRDKDSSFAIKVERAEALAVERLWTRITKAAEKDWRAALCLLERRHPEMFARPDVQLNLQLAAKPQHDNLSVWLQQGAPVALNDKEGEPFDIEDLEFVCEAEGESQKALPHTSTLALPDIETMDLTCDSEPTRSAIMDGDPRPGAGMAILAAHARRKQTRETRDI
jgi:hypothetical protein